MALPPDKLPPPPEINLLPGREPRTVDTGAGSSVTFSGCVLHYTCDDTVTTDSSGNSNTGILTGTGTALSTGLINNKLTFNGSGYIAFTSTSAFAITQTGAISACCWVKTTATDGALLSLRDVSGTTYFVFSVGSNAINNAFTGQPSVGIRGDNNVGLTTINSSTAVNDGNWHHVAFTRNSSQLITIYIDGVSNTSATDGLTSGVTPTQSWSAIAKDMQGQLIQLIGSIDDFQIYNRALTSTEITSIYNGGIAAPAAYTLSAVPGTFTLTGIAAGVPRTYIMPATAGSFAVTGVAANLVYVALTFYTMPAATGSFVFTGIAASLVYQTIGGYTLAAAPGAFTTTGIAANTLYGRTLQQTTVGNFTITTFPAGSIYSYVLAAVPGAFTFTATAAGTLMGYMLPSALGTFALTGIAANLVYGTVSNSYVLTAAPSVFVFTGIDANLVYKPLVNYVLVCGTGQFYFTGTWVGSPGAGLGISGGLGTPVVTVLFGGAPVIDVTYLGPKAGVPVSEAAPGEGIPVTKVLTGGGTPVVYI